VTRAPAPPKAASKSRYAYLFEGGDAPAPKATGRVSYTAPVAGQGAGARARAAAPEAALPSAPLVVPGAGGKTGVTAQPSAPPATAAGQGAGESGEYVSAAKRDAMKKREWEAKNRSGDGGQSALDEQMAQWYASQQGK